MARVVGLGETPPRLSTEHPWLSYPDVLVCRLSPDENGGAVSQKRPFITADRLEAIASRYPTPFYLYDEKVADRKSVV